MKGRKLKSILEGAGGCLWGVLFIIGIIVLETIADFFGCARMPHGYDGGAGAKPERAPAAHAKVDAREGCVVVVADMDGQSPRACPTPAPSIHGGE